MPSLLNLGHSHSNNLVIFQVKKYIIKIYGQIKHVHADILSLYLYLCEIICSFDVQVLPKKTCPSKEQICLTLFFIKENYIDIYII